MTTKNNVGLIYRNNTNLLIYGYTKEAVKYSVVPTEIMGMFESYYDETFYWIFNGIKLQYLIKGAMQSIKAQQKPKVGDSIKLSDGRNGIITSIESVSDVVIITLNEKEESVHYQKGDKRRKIVRGRYVMVTGLVRTPQFNGIIGKCTDIMQYVLDGVLLQ